MNKNLKPDFICVSPHKTGTTWLYVVLKAHPQVWIPPKKELWFFNQMGESYIGRWIDFLKQTGMPGDNRRSFKEDIRARFKQNIFRRENRTALWWWLKFLFLPYNFHTYSYLFPSNSDLLSGDITPNYYFIKSDLIRQLSQHNPNIRIIIILRDPVERAWSYTRMDICNYLQKSFQDISCSEFIEYFDHLHFWWKPYLDSILIWKKHFQYVYIGYYDLLQKNPSAFYVQICEFLQIDNFKLTQKLSQPINRGKSEALPDKLLRHLIHQYISEIRELIKWSDSPYPNIWLKKWRANKLNG